MPDTAPFSLCGPATLKALAEAMDTAVEQWATLRAAAAADAEQAGRRHAIETYHAALWASMSTVSATVSSLEVPRPVTTQRTA